DVNSSMLSAGRSRRQWRRHFCVQARIPGQVLKEILQNLVAFDWRQWRIANSAKNRSIPFARFGLHPDDLVLRITLRAGEILRTILGHGGGRYRTTFSMPQQSAHLAHALRLARRQPIQISCETQSRSGISTSGISPRDFAVWGTI